MRNKPIVDALREAARICAEWPEGSSCDNIYGALTRATPEVDWSFYVKVLEPLACRAGLYLDDNHERVMFLLFAAEIAATGDL